MSTKENQALRDVSDEAAEMLHLSRSIYHGMTEDPRRAKAKPEESRKVASPSEKIRVITARTEP